MRIAHTDNYVAQSLAHQLARSIASDTVLDSQVREVAYLCVGKSDNNGNPVFDNAVTIRFTNDMCVRIIDIRDPSEHGVSMVDFGADGEIYNYGRRYYRRSDYPESTDAQWHDAVAASIAADCNTIAALRGEATHPGNM